MEKEFKAKTVDEAKALAAKEFGVSADDIDFEIIEQPRKTIFKGLKGEAIVRAFYEPREEAPVIYADETDDDSESEETNDVSDEFSLKQSPSQDDGESKKPREDAADENDSEEYGELPEDFDISKSIKVNAAIKYLTDVFHELGLENFAITPERRGGNIILNITGEKLGVIIGKRGETLDSLQYLAVLASSRAEETSVRISLDCNGYRDKRRETLNTLARKTSAKVIKQGRRIALEPMNPYERRIIHSCVAEIDGVSSRSSGTEPYRRVVIYADRPKFDNRRRSSAPRGNRRDYNEGAARNYRSSDRFSTSFEREYKRAKVTPDENANAGEFSKETVDTEKNAALYGKLEL